MRKQKGPIFWWWRASRSLSGGLAILSVVLFLTSCNPAANQGEPTAASARPTNIVSDRVNPSPTNPLPTATIAPTATPLPPPPSPSPVPTTSDEPTALPSATPQPTPTAIPSPTPVPVMVNGIPASEFIIMDAAVLQNVRTIYAQGQALGRNPRAFSKLGDSLVLTSHYLTKFDTGLYNLGPDYAYLQEVIDHFSGSFQRYGVAVKVGLHAWGIFDPFWADDEWCQPGEHMLDCEIRLYNPSIFLVRMGTNDNGSITEFENNMRQAVETMIANGIIPVLGTKADRFEGDNRNNLAIRRIAADYQVPIWDFDVVADTLPGRGLSEDDVHLTIMYEHDYTDPDAFERGYPVNDLTGLMMLDALLKQVILAEN